MPLTSGGTTHIGPGGLIESDHPVQGGDGVYFEYTWILTHTDTTLGSVGIAANEASIGVNFRIPTGAGLSADDARIGIYDGDDNLIHFDTGYLETSYEVPGHILKLVLQVPAAAYNASSSYFYGFKYPYTTTRAKLATPTGLAATAHAGYITLTWNAVTGASGEPVGYYIQRATDSGFTAGLTTFQSASTSYSDATATAGTTYYYRIRASGRHRYSDWTAGVSKAALAPGPMVLSASARNGAVQLTWTGAPPQTPIIAHYATAAGGPWTRYNVSSESGSLLVEYVLTNDTPYWFVVDLSSAGSPSTPSAFASNEATATPTASAPDPASGGSDPGGGGFDDGASPIPAGSGTTGPRSGTGDGPRLRGWVSQTGGGNGVTLEPPPGLTDNDLWIVFGAWFYEGGGSAATVVPPGWATVLDVSYGYHRRFWLVRTDPNAALLITRANARGYEILSTAWFNTTGVKYAYKASASVSSGDHGQVAYSATTSPVAGAYDVALYGFAVNGAQFDAFEGFTGTRQHIAQVGRRDDSIGGTPGAPFYPDRWWDLALTVQAETGTLATGTRRARTTFGAGTGLETGAYGTGDCLILYGLPAPDCYKDTFTRTVTDGIGTADNGDAYNVSGATPEVFDVDGSRLQFTPAGDGTQWLRYERVVQPDALVRMTFTPNAIVAAGGGDVQAFGVAARWQTSGSAYTAIANIGPDFQDLTIYRSNPWSLFFSPLATTTIPAAVAGQAYTLTLAPEGTSPTLLTATWRNAAGVLATISILDNFAALQDAGRPGWGFDFQGDADSLTAQGDNFLVGDCAVLRSSAPFAWLF